jgi:agmatinase
VASLGPGGDHLTSYPALKALAKKHGPLSLIHFDAHPDLVEAPHLFHGSMFGVAVLENLIDPDTSIQIGIRTPSPPSPKLRVLTADRCLRMDGKAIAQKIKDVVGTRKCATSRSMSMRWTRHIQAVPELRRLVGLHRHCSEKSCGT